MFRFCPQRNDQSRNIYNNGLTSEIDLCYFNSPNDPCHKVEPVNITEIEHLIEDDLLLENIKTSLLNIETEKIYNNACQVISGD